MKMKINFKNNFSLRKLFFNNKFVIVFSLIAAIVLWTSITIVEAPDTEYTIQNVPVTIKIEDTAASAMGLDVVINDSLTKTVSVTVRGPKYIVNTLNSESISVTAPATSVTAPGKYNLVLNCTKNINGDYEIVKTNPTFIVATFDYIDTKIFDVVPYVDGASASEGLIAQQPILSDNFYSKIKIKGPRTELEKIDRVVASATANEVLSKSKKYDSTIILYDNTSQVLPNSSFKLLDMNDKEISSISVTQPIGKQKELPIKVVINSHGINADNLKYSLDYDKLYVTGPVEIIDTLTEIKLQPIDLFDIVPTNGNKISFNVVPELTNGVKITDQTTSINVVFDMTNYSYRTMTVTSFKSTDGTEATLDKPITNIKIFGLRSALNSITPNDLVATADLKGKPAGNHEVEITILCTKNYAVWQVGECSATVTIK